MERAVVLLVSEDEPLLVGLRASLGARYRLAEAAREADAVQLVAAGGVDLVLLDNRFPAGAHASLVSRLKNASHAKVPVLLMVEPSAPEARDAGLEAGADDVTQRPPELYELLHRARHLLESRRREQIFCAREADAQMVSGLHQDLLSLLVHDLRNPLAGLLLTLDCTDTLDNEGILAARGAAYRIRDLLDDLTEARALEDARGSPRRVRRPLAPIIEEAMEAWVPQAELRGVHITLHAASHTEAAMEPRLVRRAVEAVLSHCLRQSSRGGEVAVTVMANAAGVSIEVSDGGPALLAEARTRIFERFGAILERRSGRRSWQGIGLYLVRLVAESHGGSVSHEATGPRGNRFRIELPDEG